MEINWLESLIFGIVSGLTEFLPVSAQAHQTILMNLYGEVQAHSLLVLFARLGSLASVLLSVGPAASRMYREHRLSQSSRRRRKRPLNMQAVLDIRFLKMACIPLAIGFVAYTKTMQWNTSLPMTALFLLLNGILLHMPAYMASGNKDSRSMSALDGVLFGFGAALSVLPGVSRITAAGTIAEARGASANQSFRWSLLLSIPALIGFVCFDVYGLFTASLSGVGTAFILKCLASGVASYIGTSISVSVMKNLTARGNASGFAYYSWGAALFAFILYLF